MKEEILQLLKESKDKFISGEFISNQFGVSRASIWKYINAIKEDGYEIESVSRKGYRILSSPNILTYAEVSPYLKTKYIGRNIIHFHSIDSTNNKGKELASDGAKEGTVVISEIQTKGKGRLGRNWISPKGNIYISIILKPKIDPFHLSKTTLIGAAAVNTALKEMGIESKIKWPNDIILENKKLCGILTEMSAELNLLNYIVMGIGVNVNMDKEDFEDELKDTATSLKALYKKNFNRKELLGRILNNFEKYYEEFINTNSIKDCIKICRKNSILLGKEVEIIERDEKKRVKALDISDEGALIVEYKNGEIEEIISGEVSMRGLYGYV
ncbi:biotin--[acetyl-CoA-carboxylase] ligase [Hathewaya histolytica]|uniref:biotin--[acetyl-CoA-carboxylase] ligase n=1 Tax=Hathewaya histolytica TaxID=1498 RepID=UPI003B67597E